MEKAERSKKVARKRKKVLKDAYYNHSNKLLLQATKAGNEILVDKLISSGVRPEFSDEFGCSPLYYASRYNHLHILKILVEAGASLHVSTIMKRTPLQIAAYHGHLECVKYLLGSGVDCNAVDHLGMSALHWAAENNHEDVVDTLIKAGASQNLVNKFGKTAERLAFIENNFDVCKLFDVENEDSESFFNNETINENESTSKNFSSAYIPVNEIPQSILERGLRNHLNGKDDPIKLLEEHGIKMLPVDDSTLIVNALKCGQKAVLTEAGKLALQKTQSDVIRGLYEPIQIVKNAKFEIQKFFTESKLVHTIEDVSNKNNVKNYPNSAYDIMIEKEMANSNVIRQNAESEHAASKMNEYNVTSKFKETADRIKFLEKELLRSTEIANDFRKQLGLSVELIKSYRNKYEMKQREASLYKIQLLNIVKIISKRRMNSRLKRY